MMEYQMEYVVRCLRWKESVGMAAVEADQDAMSKYQSFLRAKLDGSVSAQSEINSWFIHENGKVTHPWPGSARAYRKMLRRARPQDSFLVR